MKRGRNVKLGTNSAGRQSVPYTIGTGSIGSFGDFYHFKSSEVIHLAADFLPS